MIKLDILSDPICPWCYIGKAHLFRALQRHPDHPFALEWHPFQLNPDMPAGGMDRRAYLEAKFGGKDGAVRAYAPVVEAAEAAGLTIAFDRIERTPNTLDAHRLIHWAGLEGRQTPVVQALFEGYFEKGRDIGDRDTLVAIAAESGLDGAMVARLLASDADAEDMRVRDAHARDRGVTGVPTFVVDNRHVLRGAQPPELWEQVIAEILEQLRTGEA
ncbi:DsbA family oxidoreductase [Jannaschia rubra]|uniref:Protein-disulfide isomerase n=1 Tax=Jannaschia rubra TaxID=282197 RepID=A0A0M6XU63_9RHOB|nr:DsbA family oxidoreductase [Jannaschia rubra]CTQ33823.1 Protein-disulfide isomerase [Jannaschia rubra]SFG10025.1 Predicted dithiol-disulfide isomerase, DsbA family [Jannaschia rubra]